MRRLTLSLGATATATITGGVAHLAAVRRGEGGESPSWGLESFEAEVQCELSFGDATAPLVSAAGKVTTAAAVEGGTELRLLLERGGRSAAAGALASLAPVGGESALADLLGYLDRNLLGKPLPSRPASHTRCALLSHHGASSGLFT